MPPVGAAHRPCKQVCICSGVMAAIGQEGAPSSKVVALVPRLRRSVRGLEAARRPCAPRPVLPVSPCSASTSALLHPPVNSLHLPTPICPPRRVDTDVYPVSYNTRGQAQPGWNSISSEDARQAG